MSNQLSDEQISQLDESSILAFFNASLDFHLLSEKEQIQKQILDLQLRIKAAELRNATKNN